LVLARQANILEFQFSTTDVCTDECLHVNNFGLTRLIHMDWFLQSGSFVVVNGGTGISQISLKTGFGTT